MGLQRVEIDMDALVRAVESRFAPKVTLECALNGAIEECLGSLDSSELFNQVKDALRVRTYCWWYDRRSQEMSARRLMKAGRIQPRTRRDYPLSGRDLAAGAGKE